MMHMHIALYAYFLTSQRPSLLWQSLWPRTVTAYRNLTAIDVTSQDEENGLQHLGKFFQQNTCENDTYEEQRTPAWQALHRCNQVDYDSAARSAMRGPPTRFVEPESDSHSAAGASDVSRLRDRGCRCSERATGRTESVPTTTEKKIENDGKRAEHGPPTIQRSMKPMDARSVVNLRHAP